MPRDNVLTNDPNYRSRALARRVLAVASITSGEVLLPYEWRAYVDAVPGLEHSKEWQAVAAHGQKLPEDLARAIFPEFAEVPYAA